MVSSFNPSEQILVVKMGILSSPIFRGEYKKIFENHMFLLTFRAGHGVILLFNSLARWLPYLSLVIWCISLTCSSAALAVFFLCFWPVGRVCCQRCCFTTMLAHPWCSVLNFGRRWHLWSHRSWSPWSKLEDGREQSGFPMVSMGSCTEVLLVQLSLGFHPPEAPVVH